MSGNFSKNPVDASVLLLLALANGAVLEAGLVQDPRWYSLLYLTLPLFALLLCQRLFTGRRKRRQQELLDRFSHQAARHGLRFSCQERLRDGMLGLDARKGRLFACERNDNGSFKAQVLPLHDIEACALRSEHILRLHFRSPQPPVDLVFHPGAAGTAGTQRAGRWARLLGQLLRRGPVA
ncbi:hypothetical protein [Flaviaesturariibacter aridisoli]|uniref:Uncharacterized protein n=1 Tax=Flaviaesturariibacter aridisoli TaxID=2545761 RepID=A0A4R4DWC6_9BACT|nr:hypothetical protein [Flaviaesturariibacter aridisoli]TCZ68385.1 hypothetical protein E0486_13970 [Flaviaesturariibacter aridisoli]